MTLSAEIVHKVAIWRQKCQDNTITLAEMREALVAMRQERFNSQELAKAAKSKSSGGRSKAPAKSGEDLLKDFEGL